MRNETPRFSTERTEKVFGGKYGKTKEKSNRTATTTFMA